MQLNGTYENNTAEFFSDEYDTSAPNESGRVEISFGSLDTDEEEVLEHFSGTERKIIQGIMNVPYTAKQKVFMVYICGGYQGTSIYNISSSA